MEERIKERLEKKIPFLDFDFEKYSQQGLGSLK